MRKALPLDLCRSRTAAVKNMEEPVQGLSPVQASRSLDPAEPSQPEPLPLPDKPSIAVLPFTNMSGDPEQEYFADGIAEDIITALSRVQVALRHRPQLDLHLQGQGGRRQAGRPRARRALRAGRQRAQGRATASASPAS